MVALSRRVLIVDDSPEDRAIYRRSLTRAADCSFVLSESDSGEDGLNKCRAEPPDCVLIDYRLPDIDGVEFLESLADEDGLVPVPVVMLTGQGSEKIAVEAIKHGAQDYLVKGQVTAETLVRAIENAIEKRSLQARLHESNKALHARNARLAELCETAHSFVDHVSHEFRTPLTVIREFAAIIRDGLSGETTAEQREFLDIIVSRVDDLSVLVDDMLDTSKIEAGLLGIHRSDCQIEEIISQVRTTLERRAGASHAHFDIEIPADLPLVYCDMEKAGRVITNLVINALKFSGEPGVVLLRAEARPSEHEVAFHITDNGPGISPANLEVLFQRFRQLDSQARGGLKGFGLGLSIAKELVSLNLGDIVVESTLGQGSTFSFTVPFADRRSLIVRYLRRIRSMRRGATHIGLLEITCEEGICPDTIDEIERFVQHNTRRGDLLLRNGPRSWLLVVALNQADVLPVIDRLKAALAQAGRSRSDGPWPALTWVRLGSWHVENEAAKLIEGFTAAAVRET